MSAQQNLHNADYNSDRRGGHGLLAEVGVPGAVLTVLVFISAEQQHAADVEPGDLVAGATRDCGSHEEQACVEVWNSARGSKLFASLVL